jgi:uncharacterized protein (UPF0261 family)
VDCFYTSQRQALVGSTLVSGSRADEGYYRHQQQMMEQRARTEEQEAARRADSIRSKGEVQQGRSRALLASQGVRVDEGSALDLLLSDEALFEEQAREALYEGRQRAWQYRSQAYGQSLQRRSRSDDSLFGLARGIGSLLGGGR